MNFMTLNHRQRKEDEREIRVLEDVGGHTRVTLYDGTEFLVQGGVENILTHLRERLE